MKFFGQSGLLVLSLVLIGFASYGQQIYFEDFNAEANGATTGTATGGTWTTLPSPSGGAGSFQKRDVGFPYFGIIYIDQTGNGVNGEGVWQSNVLNIAAFGEVAIGVEMGGIGALVTDYVRAYYRVDGGPEVLFGQVLGSDDLTVFPASSAVVSGNTLQIVIRGRENTVGGIMGFHDVEVFDIAVLYSRASSAWNNTNTWSTAGFGGGSCGCTPDADSRVIIGNNRTVSLSANGIAAGVEIQNTGTLQWTANNVSLTLQRGGPLNVQNGGVLTRVATTGSVLTFTNYAFANTVAGSMNIGAIAFNGANTTINNSGTITLATSPGLTIPSGGGYAITNSGTINLGSMDLSSRTLVINNSGTINQTGNFTNINNVSDFNNLAGGTWNWSLTPNTTYDTDLHTVMDLSAAGNTFNYSAAGAQRIMPISYHNLTLSGSGAKDANSASFAVRGNWLVSGGAATFTEGNGTVSLSGAGAQTITNPAGETFYNLTINNSFATSPQITLDDNITVSNILTMTDGNVNLNGNSFTVTPNTAGALVHSMLATGGWMYGGSLVRSFPTTLINVGTVAGFFPLGDATNYRPFFLGKPNLANTNGTMTVTYTPANSATNVSFTDNAIPGPGSVTIQRRHDAFWTVSKTLMTAGTYNVRAGGTGFTFGVATDLRLTRASDATIGTAAASSIAAGDVRVNRTGLTAAQLVNSFYVSSLNGVNSPLPVSLVYFNSEIKGDEVVSTWKTAQEKNNHFFTVEKTTDLETFHEVGTVDGQGNSSEENSYSFIDDSPFMGKSYYRLRQTDYDGTFTFSNLVMIDYSGPLFPFLKAFPNPSDGKKITLEVKGITGTQIVPVSIYNQQGQKVMDILMDEDGPGIFKKEINFMDNLPAGLYILKAGRTLQLTSKLVVN